MSLPKLKLNLREVNPNWIAAYDEQGRATNMHERSAYYDIEVEVLTLNLNAGTMRVRYQHAGKNQTQDLSIQPFLDNYSIVEKI